VLNLLWLLHLTDDDFDEENGVEIVSAMHKKKSSSRIPREDQQQFELPTADDDDGEFGLDDSD
jgi:hypothetical protein